MLFITIAGMAFGLIVFFGYRLTPLLFSFRSVTLAFSPNNLRIGEVVLAILAMMMKSILPAYLDALRAPDVLTLYSPFTMSEEDLAKYQVAIGKRNDKNTDVNPIHQLLFFSALTEPAMLLLLASPACTINPLGAVNVRNRFELLRPDLCVPSSFKNIGQANLLASVRNAPRRVKRGVEYDLEVTLRIQDQSSMGGTFPVFRQISTMLEFRKTKDMQEPSNSKSKETTGADADLSQPVAQISFKEHDPMRWAALCKDYNFIHLSESAAKAFGLPGKLAHGNHAVARALQSAELRSTGNSPTWMEVHFKRPMVVPGKFDVNLNLEKAGSAGFAISRQEKVHVTAEYGFLRSSR
jgi:acyl dehydratase